MKIVILQGAFLPVPTLLGGAVEKMWFELGKMFAASGHEVIHISRTYDSLPEHEIIEGVQHQRVKGYATPSSGIYLKLLDFLYSRRAIQYVPEDADIIVTNTFWSPILMKGPLKLKCFLDVARMPKGQMKFYKKAGRLRANSSVVETAIKAELKPDEFSKVVMVPNPLTFHTDSGSLHKKEIILYTGRIHPEKGLDLLLLAFSQLSSNWILNIVGPWDTAAGGGGEEYMTRLKSIASNSPNIFFKGAEYNTDKLNNYYKEASIFVYPSVAEKGETFGLAPLEGMAWGCVPIVSDLACFKDFIEDRSNGLIFNHRTNNAVAELAGCIAMLQNDAELKNKLERKALAVRQTHSIQHIGELFIKEFERMKNEQHGN